MQNVIIYTRKEKEYILPCLHAKHMASHYTGQPIPTKFCTVTNLSMWKFGTIFIYMSELCKILLAASWPRTRPLWLLCCCRHHCQALPVTILLHSPNMSSHLPIIRKDKMWFFNGITRNSYLVFNSYLTVKLYLKWIVTLVRFLRVLIWRCIFIHLMDKSLKLLEMHILLLFSTSKM